MAMTLVLNANVDYIEGVQDWSCKQKRNIAIFLAINSDLND